jgi:hypothetical protein
MLRTHKQESIYKVAVLSDDHETLVESFEAGDCETIEGSLRKRTKGTK